MERREGCDLLTFKKTSLMSLRKTFHLVKLAVLKRCVGHLKEAEKENNDKGFFLLFCFFFNKTLRQERGRKFSLFYQEKKFFFLF